MVVECPLCKSKTTIKRIKTKDFSFSGEFFEIHECNTCLVGFTLPELSKKELEKYYNKEKYHSYQKDNSGFSLIYKFIQKINSRYKLNILNRLGIKNLLDYGSGSGEFVRFCNNKGISAFGFEPINKVKSEMVYQNINKIKDKRYDCVTLWHVLEHTKDPLSVLKFVKGVLNEGGWIIVALPNKDSYDNIYYGKTWAGYDVPRHQYHFNPESFKNLISSIGLKTEFTKPLFFDAFYVSVLSEKNSNNLFWFIRGLIIGMWSNIRAFFDKKHSSIIYIIKR